MYYSVSDKDCRFNSERGDMERRSLRRMQEAENRIAAGYEIPTDDVQPHVSLGNYRKPAVMDTLLDNLPSVVFNASAPKLLNAAYNHLTESSNAIAEVSNSSEIVNTMSDSIYKPMEMNDQWFSSINESPTSSISNSINTTVINVTNSSNLASWIPTMPNSQEWVLIASFFGIFAGIIYWFRGQGRQEEEEYQRSRYSNNYNVRLN